MHIAMCIDLCGILCCLQCFSMSTCITMIMTIMLHAFLFDLVSTAFFEGLDEVKVMCGQLWPCSQVGVVCEAFTAHH